MECKDCEYNIETPGVLSMAPAHRCNMTVERRIIWSPYGPPSWCPLKEEEKH
jgi:hypothetical protein